MEEGYASSFFIILESSLCNIHLIFNKIYDIIKGGALIYNKVKTM